MPEKGIRIQHQETGKVKLTKEANPKKETTQRQQEQQVARGGVVFERQSTMQTLVEEPKYEPKPHPFKQKNAGWSPFIG